MENNEKIIGTENEAQAVGNAAEQTQEPKKGFWKKTKEKAGEFEKHHPKLVRGVKLVGVGAIALGAAYLGTKVGERKAQSDSAVKLTLPDTTTLEIPVDALNDIQQLPEVEVPEIPEIPEVELPEI